MRLSPAYGTYHASVAWRIWLYWRRRQRHKRGGASRCARLATALRNANPYPNIPTPLTLTVLHHDESNSITCSGFVQEPDYTRVERRFSLRPLEILPQPGWDQGEHIAVEYGERAAQNEPPDQDHQDTTPHFDGTQVGRQVPNEVRGLCTRSFLTSSPATGIVGLLC